jgi:hypothetical protein
VEEEEEGLQRTGGCERCDYRAAQMEVRARATGDEEVTACSISMATRLSLEDCLYK